MATMKNTSQPQIDAAQERLNAALLNGKDTGPFRAALDRLKAEAHRIEADRARAESDLRAGIAAASEALAENIRAGIHARISALPSIPQLKKDFQ